MMQINNIIRPSVSADVSAIDRCYDIQMQKLKSIILTKGEYTYA